jgi:hypothetical protein
MSLLKFCLLLLCISSINTVRISTTASLKKELGNTYSQYPVSTKNPFLNTTFSKLASNSLDTSSIKNTNWYAQATSKIEADQYNIKRQEQNYVSFNKLNNLKASYTATNFSLAPYMDSTDSWELNLQVKGLYANKKLICTPSKEATITQNENSIQFTNDNQFITEYINSKEGVRQNFIILQAPNNHPNKIAVQLSTNANWFVNAVDAKEIHFAKATKNGYDKKITYNQLKVWDAHNKPLEAAFIVVKNEITIEVNSVDAVYPITIDPLSTSNPTIVESNFNGAALGYSASSAGDINGDGYSDIILGGILYTNGQGNEGVFYIFHGSATGVSTTPQTIIESNESGAFMGFSVATAGDVNADGYSDVIVGVPNYDDGELNEGAAFIYHGSATGLNTTIQAKLQINQAGAGMGYSVACAGDINADGYSDVIVSANLFDNGQTDEGGAFIYHGSPTGINLTLQTQLESNQTSALFGRSVTSAGDVNGDGYSDVIVGANLYDNGEADEGSAFIYHGSAAGLNPIFQTQLESNQVGAEFGFSVSNAGDVNGDGFSDVMVGAYLYDNGETDEGVVLIYHGSVAGVNPIANIQLEANKANAYYSNALACAGDINGDGYSDIVIGAYQYTNTIGSEGAAFVYFGTPTGISSIVQAQVFGGQIFSRLGSAVSSAGDVNGDGYSDVLVGASGYSNIEGNEGGGYIYNGASGGLSNAPGATPNDANAPFANYGYSVASAGDVNGDGFSDVIIGAFTIDDNFSSEGLAYLYYGSANGLSVSPNSILDDANANNAYFGCSVASAGDVNGDGYGDVIVGAYGYKDGANNNEGRAFVYYGSAGGLSASPNNILDDANQANAQFGFAVASAGDVNGDGYSDVVVGAVFYDDPLTNEGKAFIHHGSASGLSVAANSSFSDANQSNAFFGYSVASAGDVNGDGYSDVLIGAQFYDDAPFTDEGNVFVYYGSPTGLATIPSDQLNDANQAASTFGRSVASAGDVNGDGFSDVIIGAYGYDDGNVDEGRAFVYYGSATGLSASPNSILDDADQAVARFGHSVASAGDVNGDGYSDVIVGAYNFDDFGNTDEGTAYIYYGSPTGLAANPSDVADDANQVSAQFGWSVAGAGDVNGDGYNDIVIGALNYKDGPNTSEGRAFIYYGNNGKCKRNNINLYNTDLVTPIQQNNAFIPNVFGAGLFAKSYMGRVKGKMVWEVKQQGQAFSGNPITNSTAYLDKQSAYYDLGINGTELKNLVQKNTLQNKIRLRVEYDRVTAITGQIYGPWRYPADYLRGAHGMNSTPLPLQLIAITAQWIKDKEVEVHWITANERSIDKFVIEKSIDGAVFNNIGTTIAYNNLAKTDYAFIDKNAVEDLQYYRLKIIAQNGTYHYSKIVQVNKRNANTVTIHPNLITKGTPITVAIYSNTTEKAIWQVYTTDGKMVQSNNIRLQKGTNTLFIPSNTMSAGTYLFSIQLHNQINTKKIIVE